MRSIKGFAPVLVILVSKKEEIIIIFVKNQSYFLVSSCMIRIATFPSSSLTSAISMSAIFSADKLRPTSDWAADMISSLVRNPLLSLSSFLKARRSKICLKISEML